MGEISLALSANFPGSGPWYRQEGACLFHPSAWAGQWDQRTRGVQHPSCPGTLDDEHPPLRLVPTCRRNNHTRNSGRCRFRFDGDGGPHLRMTFWERKRAPDVSSHVVPCMKLGNPRLLRNATPRRTMLGGGWRRHHSAQRNYEVRRREGLSRLELFLARW